jgi:PAS domain S-box-containing protein
MMNDNSLHHLDKLDSFQHPRMHDHLCLLYSSEEEWQSFIGIFIKTGLAQGEKCIYIFDTHTSRQVHEALRSENIDVTEAEASGQLSILHGNRVFISESEFNPEDMRKFIRKEASKALSGGFPIVRITSESDWVLKYQLSMPGIMKYETNLNQEYIVQNPCMIVCQYDRTRFSNECINSLLSVHPSIMLNQNVHENIYYLPEYQSHLTEKANVLTSDLLSMIEREELRNKANREVTRTLEVLLDESQSAIIVVGEDGCIVDANQRAESLLEADPDNLTGRSIRDYIDKPKSVKGENEINPFGVAHRGEIKIRVNGKHKILNVTVVQVNPHGQRLYYAIGQDITAHRQAEEELKINEGKFNSLIQCIDQGVALHEIEMDGCGNIQDLVICDVNPAFETTTGLTRSQVLGVRASSLYGQSGLRTLKKNIESSEINNTMIQTGSLTLKSQSYLITVIKITSNRYGVIFSASKTGST